MAQSNLYGVLTDAPGLYTTQLYAEYIYIYICRKQLAESRTIFPFAVCATIIYVVSRVKNPLAKGVQPPR